MEEFQQAVDGVHDSLAELQKHRRNHRPRARARAKRTRRPSRNSFGTPLKIHNHQSKEGEVVVKSSSSTAIDIDPQQQSHREERQRDAGGKRSRPTDLRGWCRRASRLAAQCQQHLLRTFYIPDSFSFAAMVILMCIIGLDMGNRPMDAGFVDRQRRVYEHSTYFSYM